MSRVNVFFATGYEEVEALTVVDLLRRAGIETDMVSVTGNLNVTSSHNVTVKMDKLFEDVDDSADMIVLPGGVPGTPNLKAHKELAGLIRRYHDAGKYIAAICAAPTVYGEMGLLEGKNATCYPGMEDGLLGANKLTDKVVIDGTIITSRGLGTAIDFGLALVGLLKGSGTAEELASKIVYTVKC
ncbi:MAG: DJ-1/PfpI family protein [Clostridium sp.]|nr:DJ-1/PfpI family protein [Clostridium sp.]MCM1398381.1 DJ-1/PfpI family protein [Clostridium sp.]MCM1458954.1 DJ-1/PfpI family protein [Bacteroides sp.]